MLNPFKNRVVDLGTHTVTQSSFTGGMLINIIMARGIFFMRTQKKKRHIGVMKGLIWSCRGLIRQRAKCEEQVTPATNHLSKYSKLKNGEPSLAAVGNFTALLLFFLFSHWYKQPEEAKILNFWKS